MWRLCLAFAALAQLCGVDALAKSAKPPTPAAPPAAPRRITSNSVMGSGMSLKQQIGLVRAINSPQRGAAVGRSKAPQKRSVSAKKNETDDSNFHVGRPMVLVDGYNLIFKNRRREEDEAADADFDMDGAREQLISSLCAVAVVRSWDVVVAFDAAKTASQLSRERASPRVEVVYTSFDRSADAFIETASYDRRNMGEGATIVATDDGMIRLMASASGATLMSSDQLQRECVAAKNAVSQKLESSRLINEAGLSSASRMNAEDDEYDVSNGLFRKFTGLSPAEALQAAERKRLALTALVRRVAATKKGSEERRTALLELRDVEARLETPYRTQTFRNIKKMEGLLEFLDDDWPTKHASLLTAPLT
mmetsp:Transcript_10369/g.34327  ORF Transcript_10369/g.34327 Transcript_10369/m.34327 type:complete len:365 (-) Transcript_10369:26-1120(-)